MNSSLSTEHHVTLHVRFKTAQRTRRFEHCTVRADPLTVDQVWAFMHIQMVTVEDQGQLRLEQIFSNYHYNSVL